MTQSTFKRGQGWPNESSGHQKENSADQLAKKNDGKIFQLEPTCPKKEKSQTKAASQGRLKT
jgi:hypothetical protein